MVPGSGKRGDVILATKVGIEMGPQEKGLSKRYILQAVERSLQRLQTDYIDLYQSHIDDPATPLEETFGSLWRADPPGQGPGHRRLELYGGAARQGARSEQAERSSDLCLPSTPVQPLRSRRVRRRTGTALPEGRSRSHPLLLTRGRVLDGQVSIGTGPGATGAGATVKKYLNERGFRILQALDQIASQLGSTPGQVALAWLASRPAVTAPIASATSLEQLNHLIEATRLELDPTALDLLNRASA